MVFFTVVCLLWAMFWSMAIAFATGFLGKMGTFLLAWGPVTVLVWYALARAAGRDKLHAAMLGALGVQAGQGFDHAEAGTGIALDPTSKTLALLGDGGYRFYTYDKVREWVNSEERASGVVGFGLAGTASAAGANVRAAREAAANTGLFVSVKDVERPRWRIAMKDNAMRARWMELLQQEINEGGAAADDPSYRGTK